MLQRSLAHGRFGSAKPPFSDAGDFADLLLEEEEALLDVYNRVRVKRGGDMDANADEQATAAWIAEKLVNIHERF